MHESISHSSPDKQTSPERLSRPQTGYTQGQKKRSTSMSPIWTWGVIRRTQFTKREVKLGQKHDNLSWPTLGESFVSQLTLLQKG